MYRLTVEQDKDWWEVEALYDLCFAPGREALSSYRLREGVAPVPGLSLVARDPDGVLGGAVRYWPVHVGAQDALLFGTLVGGGASVLILWAAGMALDDAATVGAAIGVALGSLVFLVRWLRNLR